MSDVHSQVKPLTTGRVIFAIAGIYVTQSLVSALSMQSLPALVRAAGGSLTLAGATTLFMLPWALKFIWAPWIERWRLPPDRPERRSRLLILRGQVGLAVILTVAAATGAVGRTGGFPDTQIAALFALFLLAGTIAATIDIASDGFCVDQLSRAGYGWGNSVQVGGSYLGMMCGGGVFLILAAAFDWPVAMLIMAALILVLSVPLWRIAEPMRITSVPHVPALGYALKRRQARLGLLLVLMLNTGMRFVLPLLAPLLLDQGLSMSALGALFSAGNIAAGIAGTLAGGVLMKYTSPGRALLAAYGLQGVVLLAIVTTLLLAPGHLRLPLLQGLIILQSISLACALVCLYATLMTLSSPLQAGVDFTLFQCTDAAIAILAGVVGGVIAQHFGYAACFMFGGAFTLLAAWIASARLHSTNAIEGSGNNTER
ncbi:TPA: MFS transporter [Klebsiella oxytoca]